MALTQEQLFKSPTETIEQYNARIAALRGDTQENLARQQELSRQAAPEMFNVLPVPPVPKSISSENIAPPSQPTFTPPQPTAPDIQKDFITSVSELTKTSRSALESAYQKQIDELNRQQAEAKKTIEELTKKSEGIIEKDIQPLLQPFREQLENAERERLHITENFEANQKLVNELDTLLTEGNALINAERMRPVPTIIGRARTAQVMQDVADRAGVIQAVIAARNGQIAQAERMIDRSVQAVTADRQDRINYFSTFLKFYENAKDEEGKKLLLLNNEEKQYIQSQIKLLEDDLRKAEENADYIKKLMISPESALFMAQAGIKLTDSPEEVNRKMTKQAEKNIKTGLTILGNKSATSTSLNTMIDNERSLLATFKGEPIVKNFNEILAKKLSIDAIIESGVGGPGDLALVYEFMKGLDPTSVVRETEYATAAKSGNIFLGALARFNGYLKESGGFLPSNVKEAFKSIVNSKLQIQRHLYDNVASSYKDIAKRQGLNPDNVVPNYAAGMDLPSSSPPLSLLPPIDTNSTPAGIGDNAGFFQSLLNLFK